MCVLTCVSYLSTLEIDWTVIEPTSDNTPAHTAAPTHTPTLTTEAVSVVEGAPIIDWDISVDVSGEGEGEGGAGEGAPAHIDWDISAEEVSELEASAVIEVVASSQGEREETLLLHTPTRNLLLDELMEVREREQE